MGHLNLNKISGSKFKKPNFKGTKSNIFLKGLEKTT